MCASFMAPAGFLAVIYPTAALRKQQLNTKKKRGDLRRNKQKVKIIS